MSLEEVRGYRMKKLASVSNNTSLIAKGMQFRGDLSFSGVLEVEGEVIGNVLSVGETGAELRIRETGVVKGLISVPVVVINGSVEGDIYSNNHMELAAKARVNGNVYYHLMEMVLGCVVHGRLTHMASADLIQAVKSLGLESSTNINLSDD